MFFCGIPEGLQQKLGELSMSLGAGGLVQADETCPRSIQQGRKVLVSVKFYSGEELMIPFSGSTVQETRFIGMRCQG